MKNIFTVALITLSIPPFAIAQARQIQTDYDSQLKREIPKMEDQQHSDPRMSKGLVLQANEGERMVRRWGLPMTIKVDPVNGRSKQLMVGTEDIPPGRSIPIHKHAHCDELVIIQKGSGTAILGDRRQEVSEGAMIFVPENEWVGLENTGKETIRIVFIFSAPGFEKYLRATSIPEGQPVIPFTPVELAAVRQQYKDYIVFKD